MNSPFEYIVLDGKITRMKREDNSIFGQFETGDLEAICKHIGWLDEELWSVRKSYTKDVNALRAKIKKIKEALELPTTEEAE